MRIEDAEFAQQRQGLEYVWKLVTQERYVPVSERRDRKTSVAGKCQTSEEQKLSEAMEDLVENEGVAEPGFNALRDTLVLPEYQKQWLGMALATSEAEEKVRPFKAMPKGWTREKKLVSRKHAFVSSSPTVEEINRPPRVGDLVDVSIKKNLSEIGIIGEVLSSGGFNVVMISGECKHLEGGVAFKMPFANPEIMNQFKIPVGDMELAHVGIRPALVQEMTEFLRRANMAKRRVLEMLGKTVIPQRVITLNDLVTRMTPYMELEDTPLTPAMTYYATYLAVRSIPAQWVIGPGQKTALQLLYINALDVAAAETAINTTRAGGKQLEKIVGRFQNALDGTTTLSSLKPTPQETAILGLVKRFALGEISHNDTAAKSNVGFFMRRFDQYRNVIVTQTACMDFLRRIGYIPADINPWKKAFKLQIPYQNSSEQQDEVQTMFDAFQPGDFASDSAAGLRKDWTGKKRPFKNFFCIDGPDAHEIDDGVALETRANGEKWIHVLVADPGSYIAPRSEIAQGALSRVTTAYYPSGVVGMLPKVVQEFGLLQGGAIRSLVVSAKLNKSPGNPVDHNSVRISLVNVDNGLGMTYGHVEKQLGKSPDSEENSTLHELFSLAQNLKKHRVKEGSVEMQVPRFALEDGQIVPVVQDNPQATLLVTELMVLANSLVAKYAADHQLPMLFRYQNMDADMALAARKARDANGAIDFYKGIELWNAIEMAYISSVPKPHISLGIDMYAQSTSPLRRFGDLLNHWQLHAHLKGEELPYSHEQVDAIIPHVFGRQRTVKKGQETMESYRVKEFLLEKVKEGSIYPISWRGVVLEPRRQDWVRVMVMETGMMADYKLTSPDVEIGEVLPIGKILDIDLMESQIKVAKE